MSENTVTSMPGIRPPAEKKVEIRRPVNQYVMVKNYAGALSIQLSPHDFSMPERSFKFKYNVEKLYIPKNFALGVFVTPTALGMLEKGYFTFEGLNDLIKEAEELGYYVPETLKNPIVTHKEIRALLKAGDINKMKKLLMNANAKIKRDIVDIAKQLYASLNMNVVQFIEGELKVSLKPIDLNA